MIEKMLYSSAICLLLLVTAKAQNITINPDNVVPVQVTVEQVDYKGKNALQVQGLANNEKTLAIIKNVNFHNGIIEATISGQPLTSAGETARGFVGIAFRVTSDTSKMEVFYLRPTNGRANDQLRRNHATQYISVPGYPWEQLRKEAPGQYEAYADMQSGEWIKVKIEVKNETAKLYVNNATQPTLIVNDLKQDKNLRGSIGLWIGPGTLGHFTNLTVMAED